MQESAGVLVPQRYPGVVKAALVVLRQVGAAQLNDLAVQVNHRGAFNGLVSQYLAQGASLAPSADEHRPGLGMEQHRGMHQGFVVDEFVRLGGLRFAVKNQASAKDVGIQDLHLLIGG